MKFSLTMMGFLGYRRKEILMNALANKNVTLSNEFGKR
jgi:hypothetical protein